MTIEQVKPYSKNAKKHSVKQIHQIAKSIKEFGWQQPIVVDKKGIIIAGHGRYFAYMKYYKEMKLDVPEIKVADKLTDEQVKAYRIADNKLNESDWSMQLILEELRELKDFDISLTGFDVEMLDLYENQDFGDLEKEFEEHLKKDEDIIKIISNKKNIKTLNNYLKEKSLEYDETDICELLLILLKVND